MRVRLRRVTLSVLVLAGVLGLGVVPGSGAHTRKGFSRPLVLHLKWRLVTSEVNCVAADDRYVAIVNDCWSAPVGLTLIDQQAHTRRDLSPPGCTAPPYPRFGGPWLIVVCINRPYDPSYGLYNLTSGRWSTFTVSQQCQAEGLYCGVIGVGRYWAKLSTVDASCSEHCIGGYALQNLSTGQLKPDPIKPGGSTFDDLSAASGSSPLCRPLRYPSTLAATPDNEVEPGQLGFDRGFALATAGAVYSPVYHLKRCGSPLNLTETESQPLLSSRAMAWTRETYPPPNVTFGLTGWLLPSVQRFTAALPAPLRQNGAAVVALTRRTVYVRTTYRYQQLWEAALPPPEHRAR